MFDDRRFVNAFHNAYECDYAGYEGRARRFIEDYALYLDEAAGLQREVERNLERARAILANGEKVVPSLRLRVRRFDDGVPFDL